MDWLRMNNLGQRGGVYIGTEQGWQLAVIQAAGPSGEGMQQKGSGVTFGEGVCRGGESMKVETFQQLLGCQVFSKRKRGLPKLSRQSEARPGLEFRSPRLIWSQGQHEIYCLIKVVVSEPRRALGGGSQGCVAFCFFPASAQAPRSW